MIISLQALRYDVADLVPVEFSYPAPADIPVTVDIRNNFTLALKVMC